MTDRTNPDSGPITPGSNGYSAADMATAAAQGFRDGVASLSLPAAGQEPVAWRLRGGDWHIGKPSVEFIAWAAENHPEAPIEYAAPQPAVAAGSEQIAEAALRKVLSAVQRYLPPDGPEAKDTLSEIIEIVDPWPLGLLEKP